MRPVRGFERPALQWAFVALGVALIAVAAGAAWVARRANAGAEALRAEREGAVIERQRLDAQLARERSTREALTLELARQRAGADEPLRVMPALTLSPTESRGPKPPSPTVTAQHATQIVELRLLLPARARAQYARFEVVWRDWSGGDVLWSRGGLTASAVDRQPAVTAFVTGDLLRAGSYELLLSGVTVDGRKEEVASYEIGIK